MSYDSRLLFEAISISLHESPSKTLLDISKNLRVSRRTIEKAISSSTGGTFRQFREEILLRSVRSLCVSQPTLAIKELCFAVGFKSARSFARAIKRVSGSSPEEFRFRVARELLDVHETRGYGWKFNCESGSNDTRT
jgi:transcriptional regulator GlxA family with amidase domain